MKNRGIFYLASILALAATVFSCKPTTPKFAEEPTDITKHLVTEAVCVLSPTEGNKVTGEVWFTQTDSGVMIKANVRGLTPGKHGFHVHQLGDCSAPDGTSAGGHFNPDDHQHAGPSADIRHVGDLGNIEAMDDSTATYSRLDKAIKLHGEHSIIGRAIIVHAGEDDLTSQPTGAAGARVACGVIGIAGTD